MNYIGEHLLPGQIGHFLVILSLISSLVATIAYAKSSAATLLADQLSWKRIARFAFMVDAVSVLSVFAIILLIISSHYFEYFYAWNHSDKSLQPKYLLSSIWEGQEGSFLLWTLWHCVLGLILMRTAKKWEAPVMTVISFLQVCLATMILGIYIFDYRLGSSPFILTRHLSPDVAAADYMSLPVMQNGKGLNQLLQNYWMVIHPPVLFLGFASTVVPFAYAIAGLWKRDHSWTKQAVPWSLFSAAILGLGIMMGAKWAYESLSFGGYWAWDPVENASLVPWLVLVAGLHTLVIFNSTGHSLRATYFFFIAQFIFILYSTYLTRSGALKDTSVHAFVTEGMNGHLLMFLLIFTIPSLALFVQRYKKIPHIAKEESSYSREFWMFIGSLVLFLSSLFIIIATSLPVINNIFNTSFDIGEDKEFPYNRVQVFVAVIIGVLTAITQYLKYKNTDKAQFRKKIWLPTLIALAISLAISFIGGINYDKFGTGFLAALHLAVFASVYTVVANATYIWAGLNGKLKAAGASVAHFGFGMMLVGILISSSNKKVLSINTFNPLDLGQIKERGFENLTLFQGIRSDMGDYWATYINDSTNKNGNITYYRIDMEKKDGSEKFTLYPDLIKATKGMEGMSNNPDAKHYWNRDIFSYINASSTMSKAGDTAQYRSHPVKIGDTLYYSEGYMILDSVIANPSGGKHSFKPTDTALLAKLNIVTASGNKNLVAEPVYYVENGQVKYKMDTVYSQGLAIAFSRVIDARHIEISMKESSQLVPFVALKVLQFPFINLLWIGTILMVVGFVMSIVRRVKLIR